ncbi:hypothetical protein AB6A40_002960 [Gnathostoma spinigerum]|uniref:t-SNARE coiled-coil homology domain-containing protein n=1 Tax=Gnathostoma spinigerum TaxID=75299 RepID=A0ABD6E9F1_9BILA
MGSLNNQPPTGVMRNLTEVFLLLRNNNMQNSFMFVNNSLSASEEKMSLVALDKHSGDASASSTSLVPPDWINYLDETQYEFTKIRSRLKQVQELQQNLISKPKFVEDVNEQHEMETNTDEVTQMIAHAQRLIAFIERADVIPNSTVAVLKDNIVTSLRLTLSNITNDFRTSQAKYLKQIEARKEIVDSYLLTPSSGWVNTEALNDVGFDNKNESLSLAQIQLLLQNADIVKEREKDVMSVSRSIIELNTLFKDLAALVIDQGTLLDRIDYNVENSCLEMKSALKNIEKAEQHQRSDKKMHCIVILSIAIIMMLIIIIVTKT